MSAVRICPDGTTCINPKKCKKTKPCWWMIQKREHEIIANAALRAGRASLAKVPRPTP